MCPTVVGLSVARGVCWGGERRGRERGRPYGGDGHNMDASVPLQVIMLLLTSLSSGVFKQDWGPSSTAEPSKKDERN